MGEDTTAAAARGNAAAVLHYLEGQHPAETEFPRVLTLEEERLHFYLNDHVLEVAERADEVLRQLSAFEELGLPRLQQSLAEATADQNTALMGQIRTIIEARTAEQPAEQRDLQMELTRLETQIVQIMDNVRSDYHRLAEVLASGRETYLEYGSNITEYEVEVNDAIRRIEDEDAELSDIGYNPYAPDPDIISKHAFRAEYEANFGDYQLLKNGIAIHMTRTDLWNLVWAGVSMVLLDIVTGGIFKFVVVGTRVIGAAARATAIGGRVLTAAQNMRRRYNSLGERGKDFLERMRLRARRSDEPQRPNNGSQGRADDPAPATPRGACALC